MKKIKNFKQFEAVIMPPQSNSEKQLNSYSDAVELGKEHCGTLGKHIFRNCTIRKVNNLGLLLDAAKIIQKNDSKIRFLIYGSGDEKEMLETILWQKKQVRNMAC